MRLLLILVFFLLPTMLAAQEPTAAEIIQKAEQHFRGENHTATIRMTIVRPKWERAMEMKTWNIGEELAMIYVQSPAREKGTAFLKKGKEVWNWVPSVEREVKLPPSMMGQSWMGSDFTNDDLVRSASIMDDYFQKVLAIEEFNGQSCYKIELLPREEAVVVWGKIVTWITVNNFLQVKSEFYDEDGYLVNEMIMDEIKEIGGRLIPTRLTAIPIDEEGQKTVIEYLEIDFDADLDEKNFSLSRIKRLK